MSKIIAIVFGTRPEYLKVLPLIEEVKKSEYSDNFIIVNTNQHTDLLNDQIDSNRLVDINLKVYQHNGLLSDLLSVTLSQLGSVLNAYDSIEYLVAQGDTNTVLSCSLWCFLNQKKFIHIEAGLRSKDLQNPFPEEFNRLVAGLTGYHHFAPTPDTADNLIAEGISPAKIDIVGNTIVDQLYKTTEFKKRRIKSYPKKILVTVHRRERKEKRVLALVAYLNNRSGSSKLLETVWITHPNYSCHFMSTLRRHQHIEFAKPLSYTEFVKCYSDTDLVITDSGGVTEECITLGIPLIVFREKTERPIPEWVRKSCLVTDDVEIIKEQLPQLLETEYEPSSYFGDGHTSARIAAWLYAQLKKPVN